jgi:hypothetical protein
MEYEIHITVENNDNFIDTCNKIGVKPIIIIVDENNKEFDQVMTSSKHSGNSYGEVLIDLTDKLIENNQRIIRQKVERIPGDNIDSNHIYYESHLRLKLKKGYNKNPIKVICKYLDFHLSRNFFKRNENYDWIMITYRNKKVPLDNFNKIIDYMKSLLDNMMIEYDKIEIEECIYDSNEDYDKYWLK